MKCKELRLELSDVSREPGPVAESHLETCVECRLWLDDLLARPVAELKTLPVYVPACVFSRITLPEGLKKPGTSATDSLSQAFLIPKPKQEDTFWNRHFFGISFGLVALTVMILALLGPMMGVSVRNESWSFLSPEPKADWGFLEPARSAGLGSGFFDNQVTIEDWTFLDSEQPYSFLEED